MLISTPLPPREGVGFYAWNLARQLAHEGHSAHIITRGSTRPTWKETVDGLDIWRATFLPIYPFHVHLHGWYVDRLLARLKTELDVLHLHSPLVKAPKVDIPTLVTVHSPMKADAKATNNHNWLAALIKLQTPLSIQLETSLFRRADRLTSVAGSVAQDLRAYGIDPANVRVLGNLVDTSIFYPIANLSPGIDRPFFLTAGRLVPGKGLEDLVDCAVLVTKQYPEAQFMIAGAGTLRPTLARLIQPRGLVSTVKLIGHIADRSRMAELYRRTAAYIHPSHHEGLPTVLLEAMACGTPVIATAVGGVPDVIEPGVNGLLVSTHAPGELAQAAQRLLEDPELGERLGAAASATARQCYGQEIITRNYLAEYQSILGASHP